MTIAAVEDTNMAHPGDWSTFRRTFGLTGFKEGNFKQVNPGCANPGQNGDEIEAALDVEWATSEGVIFFIAQGDSGANECAPVEPTAYCTRGINSGDNTSSAFAVDVGRDGFHGAL